MARELRDLRERIEACDRRILDLLRERLDIASDLVPVKLDRALPFRDAGREDHVLSQVRRLAADRALDPHEIERLYRVILDMSVACQRERVRALDEAPLRVAYQGAEGSYSHLTAQRRYAGRAGGVMLTGYETFGEVAARVLAGEADYGLLPIENTTAGSINETYDLLAGGGLKIVGEEIMHVVHCLLGLPGSQETDLRTVLSHPQALAQCREYLDRLGARVVPEYDTAGAARRIRELGDASVGAIASEEAGRLYGLEILRSGINTHATNLTRFVEIAREAESCPAGVPIKTSMILELPHQAGSLLAALRVFAEKRTNLVKLESRPLPERPFQYRFYVDVEGHGSTPPVSDAIALLRGMGIAAVLLGSYPAGK